MSVIFINPYRFAAADPSYDAAAQAYITAVENTDGQALETGVRDAINAFVVGCKGDGIWDAIKAACIMAGARTRLGALTSLKGTAPTSVSFVDGDYNRETGLKGNASTKYLNSNRAGNADPRNSFSLSVYVTEHQSPTTSLHSYIGHNGNAAGASTIGRASSRFATRNRTSAEDGFGTTTPSTGFVGTSRAASGSFTNRGSGENSTRVAGSGSPASGSIFVFGRSNNVDSSLEVPTNARLAWYHIGEALDLALLDARVTTLITDIAAAIS